MKKISYLPVFILLFCFGFAQGQNNISAGNPFEKFEYGETKIATLSQGKYAEFHDKKHIVKIGSFLYDTRSKKITAILDPEEAKDSENADKAETVSRFMSIDPLFREYPHYSPYSFSGNKVIHAIELEGLEEYIVTTYADWRLRMFEIRPGDNLTIISEITGVALKDIIKWNVEAGIIDDPNQIEPHQSIVLRDITGLVRGDFQKPKKTQNSFREQTFVELVSGENAIQREAEWVLYFAGATKVNPSKLFSRQSFLTGIGKTTISGLTQASMNEGDINIPGAFADGFLKFGAGAFIGSAYEYNYNIFSGNTSSSSIFTNTKSFEEFGVEAGSSLFFGFGSNKFSEILYPESRSMGEFFIEAANIETQEQLKEKLDINEG